MSSSTPCGKRNSDVRQDSACQQSSGREAALADGPNGLRLGHGRPRLSLGELPIHRWARTAAGVVLAIGLMVALSSCSKPGPRGEWIGYLFGQQANVVVGDDGWVLVNGAPSFKYEMTDENTMTGTDTSGNRTLRRVTFEGSNLMTWNQQGIEIKLARKGTPEAEKLVADFNTPAAPVKRYNGPETGVLGIWINSADSKKEVRFYEGGTYNWGDGNTAGSNSWREETRDGSPVIVIGNNEEVWYYRVDGDILTLGATPDDVSNGSGDVYRRE